MDEDEVDEFDYAELLADAPVDTESLTLLLVTGASRSTVLDALGAGTDAEPEAVLYDEDQSSYAAAEIPYGVVAFEHTGYADPSPRVLAALSALAGPGGRAAVARFNIQGHDRFGCARGGTLVFDADEFRFVEAEEKDAVPDELRTVFDAAWIDLDSEEEDDVGDGLAGVVMAALFTGLRITAQDMHRAVAQGYHRVPMLTYLQED